VSTYVTLDQRRCAAAATVAVRDPGKTLLVGPPTEAVVDREVVTARALGAARCRPG
jgi:hypothetical protein